MLELPIIEHKKWKSCCHLYPIKINNINKNQRDAFIDEISKSGTSVNRHFIILPMLTFFKTLKYEIKNYPVSNVKLFKGNFIFNIS